MRQKFANNAESVLVKGVAKLENSLWIKTEHSESFPRLAPPISDVYNDSLPFFLATLSGKSPGGEENRWEIIRVIRCDGGELLARRGQEGTLARSWPAGTSISLRMTAETARRMLAIRPMVVGPGHARVGVPAVFTISNYCSFLVFHARAKGKVFKNEGNTITITPTPEMDGYGKISFACAWREEEIDFDSGLIIGLRIFS